MDQSDLRAWEHRCIQEEPPWCQASCPLHVDVRAFLERMAAGDAAGARKILERTQPLSGILGRLCEHPCETVCKRAEAGEALAVGALERACVEQGGGARPLVLPAKGKRAAILGHGLAALVCAWDLIRKGFGVTLFAPGPSLGGRLRSLPEAALPAAALDGEIARILALGLEVRAGQNLDAALLEGALGEFAAVFLDADGAGHLVAAPPDALTLDLDRPGLFAGGFSGPEGLRWIDQAADGRRAAASMDRHMSGASLTAQRDKEGPFATRLATSLAGVEPLARVPLPEKGYAPQEAAAEAARCLNCQCLDCVKVCAFLEKHKGYPKKYARQIYNNAAIVKGQHLANKLINSCSLCGLCTEVCPERFSMADLCLEARRDMVARGKMPASAHEFALEDMASANGPECGLVLPAQGICAHLFFPGCQLAASHPAHVRAVYDFLGSRLAGGVGLLLGCCGIPAHWAGREDLFLEALAHLRGQWDGLGRPRVVAACASCLDLFRTRAPELNAVSLWEVLGETGLPEARGVVPAGPVAVHDPCTSRHDAAAQAAVRGLLQQCGVAFEDLPLSGRFTECCGYGGLMSEVDPALARQVAAQRAASSPLDFAASCAMCRDRLAAGGKRVYHVLDFLFPGETADPAAAAPSGLSARRAARAALRRGLARQFLGQETPEESGPELRIAPEVLARMEERHILEQDARQVIMQAEAGGLKLQDRDTGRFLACFRPRRVTYWVEYGREDDALRVWNAWSHRMEVNLAKGTATGVVQAYAPESGHWTCGHGPLESRPVEACYLESSFSIALLACPQCGLALVPESVALGRMAEVEQLLEDK